VRGVPAKAGIASVRDLCGRCARADWARPV